MADQFTKKHYNKSIKTNSPLPLLKYFRWERYFTRPLASLVVRAVFKTSITPNQLTYVSFFFGLAAAAAFLGGSHFYFILGGVLWQLSSVFDCADGQLARAKDIGSRYGAYLDLFLDRIAENFLGMGMAFGLYNHSQKQEILILALIFLMLYNLQVILYYIVRQYQGITKLGDRAEARGFTAFTILLASLLNRLDLMLVCFATMIILNIPYRMYIFLWKERPGLSLEDTKRSAVEDSNKTQG